MKKQLLSALVMGAAAFSMSAAIPAGYYDSLVGKSGQELKDALAALAENHTVISYNGGTWEAFVNTDVITVRGRQAWRDMYSNNLVYLPGHDAMNIEHSVANSWWGGDKKTGANADLFHLNPSDQMANGKKSNLPAGIVAEATLLDNGVIKIGTPAEGYGDGATSVFEPTDENKGDFARAFMYVFTAYPTITWKEDLGYMYTIIDGKAVLKDWAVNLLLDWDRQDPVDSREKARNEAIFQLQNNRNPFIDIADLGTLVFGASDAVFAVNETTAIDRPEAPEFNYGRMVGLNTFSGRYWADKDINISNSGELWVSYDGNPYEKFDSTVTIPATDVDGTTHSVKAYCVNPAVTNISGTALRSPVASISMRACDPNVTDWSLATWMPVNNVADIDTENYYIILSANTLHAMSIELGATAKFMNSAGFVDFDANGVDVTELPAEAAIVKFGESGNETHPYTLGLYDVKGGFKGYWNTVAKNTMKLDTETATAGAIVVEGNGNFKMTFTEFGRLQFNKSQPRFLNYESTQGDVKLYKFKGFNADTAVTAPEVVVTMPVVVQGNNIIAPAGGVVYDLSGRQVSGANLRAGIYVVAAPGARSVKIAIR